MAALELHPDRLLPTDSGVRGIARALYAEVKDLPIISPHGHVPPRWLSEDTPFTNATALLITPDHYVTRLLHAHGVNLADLGVNQADFGEDQSREAFRILCRHWPVYRGTPVRLWLETVLVEVFEISVVPSGETADEIYDAIQAALATQEFRPRTLFDRFRISILATTDDPCADLHEHAALAADDTFTGRVVPTFRPDNYLEAIRPDWINSIDRLAAVSGIDTGTVSGLLAAMRSRRDHFIQHGAVSADHSHRDARACPLTPADAERLYAKGRSRTITPEEAATLRSHLMFEMAAMSAEDGLVMTIHPAVYRNHHSPTCRTFGGDVGADIPMSVEYTRALHPILTRFGTAEHFQAVLFAVDETVFSREIAPLASFYPSVYAGAPWWFLDAPEAIRRYQGAITETAGFGKTSGFIDDTRAICSIPARHDMSRRLDAGFLAQLVAEHRLTEDEACETLIDLVTTNPKRAFKL